MKSKKSSNKVKKLPSSSSFSKKSMLVFAAIFGVIGIITLVLSFAATKSVVYFGSLTASKPSVSYKVTTGTGNMHVDFSNNTADVLLTITNNKTGAKVGQLKSIGKKDISLDAKVTDGTYLFKLTTTAKFDGKKGYKIAIAYPEVGTVSPTPVTDTTPPSTLLSAPLDQETVTGTVDITAVAADASGVSKVDFFVNDQLIATDTTSPYTTAWNSTAVANGAATVSAKAYDARGNMGEASGIVDVSNPSTTSGFDAVLLQPPAGKLLIGAEENAGAYTTAKNGRGKELHVYHMYAKSGDQFSGKFASAPTGTIPMINFKPGGVMGAAEYKAIANGDRDASIKAAATAAKAYGKRFFLAPLHEPENDDKNAPYVGDADYARAYRRIVDVMRANGATNIVTVWNMMGLDKWMSRYDTLYPGDSYVDWIASDPYSHQASDTLTTFHSVQQFYAWAAPKKKPMMWAEWGYDSANVSSAGTFFSQAGLDKLQKDMPLVKGLIYWSEWEYDLVNFPTLWKNFSNFEAFNWNVPTGIGK